MRPTADQSTGASRRRPAASTSPPSRRPRRSRHAPAPGPGPRARGVGARARRPAFPGRWDARRGRSPRRTVQRVHADAEPHGCGQPEASCDLDRELVGGGDVADRAVDEGSRRRAHAGLSTSTPGLSRPSGSNSCLSRRCSSATAGSTGRCGAGCSWCTMPTPTSATNRPVPDELARAPGGHRPASARGQFGRRIGGHEPNRLGLRRDVVDVPLEQHEHLGTVPQHRRRAVEPGEQLERVGRDVNHCSNAARGRVRRITSPMKPSVPREPTRSRHRSNPLTFFTVGPPAFTTSPAASTYRAWSSTSRTGP